MTAHFLHVTHMGHDSDRADLHTACFMAFQHEHASSPARLSCLAHKPSQPAPQPTDCLVDASCERQAGRLLIIGSAGLGILTRSL